MNDGMPELRQGEGQPRWNPCEPLRAPVSEYIETIRFGITIRTIMTPRSDFVMCDEAGCAAFVSLPANREYDYIPIIRGDAIMGVYDRDLNRTVGIDESMLVGARDSLLGFIEYADRRRFAFVVHDHKIVGLVTLSDVQRLPVYSVVYSLLMSVEMLLMEWIRTVCKNNPDEWMQYVTFHQNKIMTHWNKAIAKNIHIDKLSCASFGQELEAAKGLGLFASEPDAFEMLSNLKDLRDMVCHGKEIAATFEEAMRVPARVRDAIIVQHLLDEALRKLPA